LTVARLKATLETAGVEFLAACGRRMFFDGEFQVDGALKSTPAHFGRGPRGDAGVLHLFDMLPLDDWRADRCKEPCSARLDRLGLLPLPAGGPISVLASG
jgi:hypothetical protein